MGAAFLFATDLHGDISRMEGLVEKGSDFGFPPIILGGDMFRSGRGSDQESQESLLRDHVEPIFSRYRGEVITIFGNNDWRSVADRFEELCPSVIVLEGRTYELEDGTKLAGLSYVPPTPFLIKDWERFEKYGENEVRGRTNGLCSARDGLIECTIEEERTMWDEISKLGDLNGKVIVSHGPPFGTCADLSGFSEHLGSVDLSRAILEMCPEAVLCGHIHEAFDISGNAVCALGGILVANPGSSRGILSCILGRYEDRLVLEHLIDRK